MKENQRIKITKMLLKNSLIELMKTKNVYKISIKEICENAGVNRSTFYNHYDTEFDLLKDIENEYLTTIEQFINLTEREAILQALLEYVVTNLDVFNLFLEDAPGNDFFERLIKMCFEKMSFDEGPFKIDKGYSQKYLYHFIVYGALSVVKVWVGQQPRETPKEMNDILDKILGSFFEKVSYKKEIS